MHSKVSESQNFLCILYKQDQMYFFLNLILIIILSIHRKEAHSAVLTSDESGVLCGPGCFNSSDQEVGLLSSVECLHMVSGYTRHSFPPFPVNWGLLLIRFTKETSECPVAFNFL